MRVYQNSATAASTNRHSSGRLSVRTKCEHAFVHSIGTVERFVALRELGLGARRIARELDIPLSTARDWCAGRVPRRLEPGKCPRCGADAHDHDALDGSYAQLLGLYLGDGCLSAHRRGVFKFRLVLDAAYAGIIDEARAVIEDVIGKPADVWPKPDNCVEVYAYSKTWPCLFPQHGRGKKHLRPIELHDWQVELVRRYPMAFLRGLIQSDGCRFENTGRDGWRAPRYAFYNLSDDIIALFCWACELVGVRWTESGNTIYVSRKADVARLDEHIGPKA